MKPEIVELDYTYKKEGSDVWVLNKKDVPVEAAFIRDEQIVHLAPRSVGGNHMHPRTEWFIGIGDLVFVWLDELGEKHSEHMHPEGRILMITVPPFLPHAVVNQSDDKIGILFEMADGKMEQVEQVTVYEA